jgi:hypothetical protein
MLDSGAPNMASSLIHGANIVIDLIRRYCRLVPSWIAVNGKRAGS